MKYILSLVLFVFATNVMAQNSVTSGVYHWGQLPVQKQDGCALLKIMEGITAELEYFDVHATTQEKGAVPKPLHVQKDVEEVIIIKEGTAKCTIGNKTAVLGKGSVLLIPPFESQSLENVGNDSLTYYVFKFRSKKGVNMKRSNDAGGALMLNYDSLTYTEENNKGTRKYFNRPTAMCDNYEMHITYLKQKGQSHKPHQHVDTEIILVIDGDAKMNIDGKEYFGGPGDLFFVESGKVHDVGNNSDKPCSYFAFKWR